jgi:hypothetical protein
VSRAPFLRGTLRSTAFVHAFQFKETISRSALLKDSFKTIKCNAYFNAELPSHKKVLSHNCRFAIAAPGIPNTKQR